MANNVIILYPTVSDTPLFLTAKKIADKVREKDLLACLSRLEEKKVKLDIINKGINELEKEIDYLTNGQIMFLGLGGTLDEIEDKVKLRKVCLKKLKGLKDFICDDPELLEDK